MTFNDVVAIGVVASCVLPGGGLLRYDPSDGTVRAMTYATRPSPGEETSAWRESVPDDGWSHQAGCDCRVCSTLSSDRRGP